MRVLLASVMVLMAAGVSLAQEVAEEDNSIPKEFEMALDKAAEASLFSIERPKSMSGFDSPKLHEYEVLGETKLSSGDRKRLATELRAAVADWEGSAAGCFKPRHKLRLVHESAIYEMLICFECSNATLYKDGKLAGGLYFGEAKKHSEPFNQVLKSAKIKIAP